ncbi:synaptopodin 2-like protein [Pygocentrus nattereri]|uniref:Synaptopodin 2-like protein n=1 Tax=Pygocentrus nattereri TaxID=42514 RepID=A0A3B4DQ18_PYGNA|nr:synaptopodin 2-like protein [Pygocentrus nattereri]
MVAEEVVVTLSGGAPWGFRLQGGAEQQKPLQVAKVRKRSKACRAGLREADELVAINDVASGELSHAEAMNLIDSGRGSLQLRIKRAPVGFQSVVLLDRAPSPRIDKEYRAALKALSPPTSSKLSCDHRGAIMSPTSGPECLTSPPDSEAYYGETDSDADVTAQDKQRRQKRRSPSSSPAKGNGLGWPHEEENSEMSGYESATDNMRIYPQTKTWTISNGTVEGIGSSQQQSLPGVVRREVVFQPNQAEWSHQGENSSENSDQSPTGAAEVDSGFQEPPTVPPPLVSPERAKEALLLASHRTLVPMVGPVDNPVDEELTVTYMDKAKQAKLHRNESVQDKQVKEARSKCRTIASLLTDAPNPHSKGVLMFKKRRQRAKKYTLTCFGSVDGESLSNTEGETEDESFFLGSESELDEDSLSAAPDPTWDSGYLDVLERRTSACVITDRDIEGSPGLSATSGKGAELFEQQRKKTEKHTSTPVTLTPASMPQQQPNPAVIYTPVTPVTPFSSQSSSMVNGEPMVVSRTSMVLSSPGQTSMGPVAGSLQSEQSDPSSGSSVHNRTARPFAPGCVSHRASTAPVVFRPNTTKKTPLQAQGVFVSTVPAPFSPAGSGSGSGPGGSDQKRAISTASLYIPPRPATVCGPPSVFSPSSSVTSPSFSPPALNGPPFPPQASVTSAPFSPTSALDSPHNPASAVAVQPYFSPPGHTLPFSPPPTTSSNQCQFPSTVPVSSQSYLSPSPATPSAPVPAHIQVPAQFPQGPNMQQSQAHKVSFYPYISVATTSSGTAITPMAQQYPLSNSSTGVSSREQRISIPAARTGILQDARRRNTKKPMFSKPEEKKPVSYNPELLSLVQNLDDRSRSGAEPGFESGPEEDSLNLGAEACNFMQAQRGRIAPPVAPKPAHNTPEIPQMGGKGAELFARRQSRMDRYVVDKQPKSPAQPREPSPTISLPGHWKYSPNVRAPPPINYNPLLSPSCPPLAQRGNKANEAARSGTKTAPGQHKQGIKALDCMSRQPYQLNSNLFSYGGSVPQTISTYQQQQNGINNIGGTLNPPKQVPVKTPRVYEIKRFSTPTPMSAPTTLSPTVIVPRSATTLAEPMWRSDITSPPPVAPRPAVPYSPPPPAPSAALPALPKFYTTPVPNAVPIPAPTPAQVQSPFQAANQFQSAPELSPLSPTWGRSAMSGSSQNLQVPRPHFTTSSMGLQPNVWRPGSMLY